MHVSRHTTRPGGRPLSQMSPMGALLLQRTLWKRVDSRLRLVDYIKRHPSVAEVDVGSPTFVVGFTRTGTTMLHELLGLHPDVRSRVESRISHALAAPKFLLTQTLFFW